MKNIIIAISFVVVIVLSNAIGNLLDKNEKLSVDLQTQIEKSSDLEMVLEDRFIKDYLRSISEKQSFSISNSIN